MVGETTGGALSVRSFFVGIFVSKLETGEAAGATGEEAFFVALSLEDVDISFFVVVADNGLEVLLPGERTALLEGEDGAGEEFFAFWVIRFSTTTDAFFWLDRLVLFGLGGARSLAEELLGVDMLTRSPII